MKLNKSQRGGGMYHYNLEGMESNSNNNNLPVVPRPVPVVTRPVPVYNNYTKKISHKEAQDAFDNICGNISAKTISKIQITKLEEILKLIVRYIGVETMRKYNLLFTREKLETEIGNKTRYGKSVLFDKWCDKVTILLQAKNPNNKNQISNNQISIMMNTL
mgnify:CR=1 FL=1